MLWDEYLGFVLRERLERRRLARIGTGRLPIERVRRPSVTLYHCHHSNSHIVYTPWPRFNLVVMSRKTAVVEEFDDDTDLPLPNRPLPNMGSRGAILAELSDEDESDDDAPPLRNPTAGPASPSQTQFKAPVPEHGSRNVTDITP